MTQNGTLFAVYVPVYLYAIMILALIVAIALWTSGGSATSIGSLAANNRGTHRGFAFLILLLSLLGTPPTVGFFAKLLTFYLLIQGRALELTVSLALTLVMLVFYLQAVRFRGLKKKRSAFKSGVSCSLASSFWLTTASLLFVLAPLVVSYLCEIAYFALV